MPNIGPMEIIVILVIVIAIFGVAKVPEMGRSLGKGMREFRKAKAEIDDLKKPLTAGYWLEDSTPSPEEQVSAGPPPKAEAPDDRQVEPSGDSASDKGAS